MLVLVTTLCVRLQHRHSNDTYCYWLILCRNTKESVMNVMRDMG